ncbi:MAG: hypothetical protein FWD53_13425 [Phycisphaerales bacterium]|nr:hypothetical protein [Phycisphaerales bacterium]
MLDPGDGPTHGVCHDSRIASRQGTRFIDISAWGKPKQSAEVGSGETIGVLRIQFVDANGDVASEAPPVINGNRIFDAIAAKPDLDEE